MKTDFDYRFILDGDDVLSVTAFDDGVSLHGDGFAVRIPPSMEFVDRLVAAAEHLELLLRRKERSRQAVSAEAPY